jgi:heme exporter protein A
MTEEKILIRRLAITGLGVERGGRRLFDGLELELAPGEAIALTGANGAGKTSLLRAIVGLLRPAAGEIRFEGENGAALDPEEARALGLHFMACQDGLKPGRTAREELDFWAGWMGGDAAALADAVKAFSLSPLLDLEVRKLSAGQRRRLGLARLSAAPRALWLLDEPMAPLDAAMRARFGAVMQAHLDKGGMILAAVHDPLPVEAREVAIGRRAGAPA